MKEIYLQMHQLLHQIHHTVMVPTVARKKIKDLANFLPSFLGPINMAKFNCGEFYLDMLTFDIFDNTVMVPTTARKKIEDLASFLPFFLDQLTWQGLIVVKFI